MHNRHVLAPEMSNEYMRQSCKGRKEVECYQVTSVIPKNERGWSQLPMTAWGSRRQVIVEVININSWYKKLFLAWALEWFRRRFAVLAVCRKLNYQTWVFHGSQFFANSAPTAVLASIMFCVGDCSVGFRCHTATLWHSLREAPQIRWLISATRCQFLASAVSWIT